MTYDPSPGTASSTVDLAQQAAEYRTVLDGLRVLQITPKGLSLRKHIKQIADALLGAGCEVDIVCGRNPDSEWMADNGYTIHFVDMPSTLSHPFWSLRAMARLARIIRERKFDLVHSHTPLGALHTNFVAKRAGAPHLFYTVRGVFHIELCNPIKRWLMTRGHLIAMRPADLIFVVADHIRHHLVRHGFPEDKIVVLPGTGVWHDHLRCSPHQRRQWRQAIRSAYGIPPGASVVVTVARLVPTKGVGELIRALSLLSRRLPNTWLLIVGDGEWRARFERLARRCKVEDRVVFAGRQDPDRVREFLAAADAFALPSYYREGLPMAPVEAMAMGLPVVLADNPPARELVRDRHSGLIVPAKSVQPLADALYELLTDHDLAQKLSTNGQQASQKYCAVNSVRVQLKAYAMYFARQRETERVAGGEIRRAEAAGGH